MTQRGGIAGCYDLDQVDVCWVPYITNGDTGIYGDYAATYAFTSIPKGTKVCRQSVNQTTIAPNCTRNLSLRPATSGYVWAYDGSSGTTGWIADVALNTNAGASGCCGPAQDDYQCGDANAGFCSGAPCDGSQSYSSIITSVSGHRLINAPEGYSSFRLGPGSTKKYYLPNGTCVAQRLRIGSSGDWTCVQVLSGSSGWCPLNEVGWILTSHLGGSC
jgi:hypothetical protein